MQQRRKWLIITICVILVVALLTGLRLKYHYDEVHKNEGTKQKVQINNKKVNSFIDITYSEAIPNSRLDIITPRNLDRDNQLPIIFWLHGGGYIAGDKQYKNPLLAEIAEQGYIIVNIDYALAPEYRYPTQLQQMDAAVRFMKRNTHKLPIDFNQVVIGGDSAGAQMASQYTAMQTNQKLRENMHFEQQFQPDAIKAAIFYGGFYDMKTVKATEFPRIQLFMESYTGEHAWDKQFKNLSQMSTINHITEDYPATFLSVGDADPFVSQNQSFNEALNAKNIPVSTFFYDGSHHLKHQYQFQLELPESKRNIEETLKFLSRNTSSSTFNQPSDSDEGVTLDPY